MTSFLFICSHFLCFYCFWTFDILQLCFFIAYIGEIILGLLNSMLHWTGSGLNCSESPWASRALSDLFTFSPLCIPSLELCLSDTMSISNRQCREALTTPVHNYGSISIWWDLPSEWGTCLPQYSPLFEAVLTHDRSIERFILPLSQLRRFLFHLVWDHPQLCSRFNAQGSLWWYLGEYVGYWGSNQIQTPF